MECNKEDAIKAQQVAEHKIVMHDYLAAKKFILKAQRLFPSLGGLPQMLAVVDIHCIACEASNDLPSKWHQILQVEQNADEEIIRKQYRKLLLLLHPDKNKFAGAASAFKLLKDAYEAFEKEKKLDRPSANTSNSQPASKAVCFWTECPKCKKQSEHTESLENQYVQCPGCLWPFLAVRLPQTKEPCMSQDESVDSLQRQTKPDSHEAEKKRNCDETKEKDKVHSSSSDEIGKKSKRKSRLKQTKTRPPMQRKRAWAASVETSERNRRHKVLSSASDTDLSSGTSFKECQSSPSVKENMYRCDVGVNIGDCSHHHEHDTTKNDEVNIGDCSNQDMHNTTNRDTAKTQDAKVRLFEKLKSAIMNEFNGGEFQAVEVRQDDTCEAANNDNNVSANDKVLQLKLAVSFMQAATDLHAQAAASENCMVGGSEIWEENQEKVQCQVPDSDVHNFDKGRQEGMFKAGQIWAVYDDDDGLPRFYAHIVEVISVHPFHVRMNWLFPAKTVSKDVQAWVKDGFAYTCGEFTFGKTLTRKSVGMFSHIMAHEAGQVPRTVRIYPQKGDVWALYKVWKPHKGATRICELVEVISHYNEELGVEVAGLFKVTGYTSIYCRKGMKGACLIPTSELTRFSHQIPAFYLVGNEVSGLPEDCVDLDMAAISVDKV